ncbi:MAG: GntR family transcriptional regulator [Desulfobacterales bacterium]|nr:GntR family transcriptional regulator [Desulfobacterales bacterium]
MEDIAAHLSDEIIEGKIQPGQQIVEADLQRALGVSRAPLREALLKLEGQGLVKIIPRKGTFIRPITPRLIRESFTVRAWMEGLAARLTTAEAGPGPLRSIRGHSRGHGTPGRSKKFQSLFLPARGFSPGVH